MKCTSFNSFTYVGNCSLKVNVALFMAHGFDIVSVPTKTFSAHLGYTDPVMSEGRDFNVLMESVQKIFPAVDLVQIGYLDEETPFAGIKNYLQKVDHKFVLVDPIHADDGRMYSPLSPRQIEMYRELIKNADAVTPNLTEAINVSGYPVAFEEITDADVVKIAEILHRDFGVKNVIIKSYVEDGEIKTYFKNKDQEGFVSSPLVDAKFVGSGDAYASMVGILLASDKLNMASLQNLQTIMYESIRAQAHEPASEEGFHDIKTDKIHF